MPDIAMRTLDQAQGCLDWVGMRDIRLPLQIQDGSSSTRVACSVQLYVDLSDRFAKGIHMSRLYVLLDEASTKTQLGPNSLTQFLDTLLDSQPSTSKNVYFEASFEHHIRRKALVSEHQGWSGYPVKIRGLKLGGQYYTELEVTVHYSSTCPASAALARQSIQQQFNSEFSMVDEMNTELVHQWLGSDKGIVATPHGQRSEARVVVRISDEQNAFLITSLVDQIEQSLRTPVQTAVKREDEQEFAMLNGQNPMFCEDACRRLQNCLNHMDEVSDYVVRVEHFESLHAHNAVSMVAKGVSGGLRAQP